MKTTKEAIDELMLEWEIKNSYMSMFKYHGNNRTPKSYINDYLNDEK